MTAQQIKRSLIDKAKLKKEYAKVQSQQAQQDRPSTYNPYDRSPSPSAHQPTTEPHPARQSLIEEAGVLAEQAEEPADHDAQADTQRRRRPKQVPFAREQWRAQKDKEEMEGRRQAREDAARQRQFKMEERERFRKAMAKARTGGKNGQRKLGRESKVLLDKVKRIVAEG